MWIDQRGSEVLIEPESFRLLALAAKQQGIGRLAISRLPDPLVRPVNFTYFNRTILIKLGPGSLADLLPGLTATFEVDQLDYQSFTGWSVIAHGLVSELGTPDPTLDPLPGPEPEPLVPQPEGRLFALRIDRLTGRRFPLTPFPPQPPSPPS